MILKVFAVYDSAAQAYLSPFFMTTVSLAVRGFKDLACDDKHQFGRYPDDYTLFQLGEFDDSTAAFTFLPAAVSLGTALEYRSQKKEG